MQKASNAVVHNVAAESGNEREGGVDFLRGPAAGPGAELAGRKCHARKAVADRVSFQLQLLLSVNRFRQENQMRSMMPA